MSYLHTSKANVNKMVQAITTMIPGKRKSERLTQEEWKALKQYRKSFDTESECAYVIGISRETLGRIILLGKSSPQTVAKIRKVISDM
jgi:predicted nucleotide-binding protein (sugar kinase/HSP70/actin superfamily)